MPSYQHAVQFPVFDGVFEEYVAIRGGEILVRYTIISVFGQSRVYSAVDPASEMIVRDLMVECGLEKYVQEVTHVLLLMREFWQGPLPANAVVDASETLIILPIRLKEETPGDR